MSHTAVKPHSLVFKYMYRTATWVTDSAKTAGDRPANSVRVRGRRGMILDPGSVPGGPRACVYT